MTCEQIQATVAVGLTLKRISFGSLSGGKNVKLVKQESQANGEKCRVRTHARQYAFQSVPILTMGEAF